MRGLPRMRRPVEALSRPTGGPRNDRSTTGGRERLFRHLRASGFVFQQRRRKHAQGVGHLLHHRDCWITRPVLDAADVGPVQPGFLYSTLADLVGGSLDSPAS